MALLGAILALGSIYCFLLSDDIRVIVLGTLLGLGAITTFVCAFLDNRY